MTSTSTSTSVQDADRIRSGAPATDPSGWLTASVRPAGELGRAEVGRLRELLDALSACASIVVLDLAAAHLRSRRAAAVIEDAARRLDRSGGALVCVHADEEAARVLAGGHAVVLRGSEQWSVTGTG